MYRKSTIISTVNFFISIVPVASPNNKKQLMYNFNTCNEVRGVEIFKQKTIPHKM